MDLYIGAASSPEVPEPRSRSESKADGDPDDVWRILGVLATNPRARAMVEHMMRPKDESHRSPDQNEG